MSATQPHAGPPHDALFRSALERSGLVPCEALEAASAIQRGLRDLGQPIPLVTLLLRQQLLTLVQANHLLRHTEECLAYCENCQKSRFFPLSQLTDKLCCSSCGRASPLGGAELRRARGEGAPPSAAAGAPAAASDADADVDELIGVKVEGYTVRERLTQGRYRGWYRADRGLRVREVFLLEVPPHIRQSPDRMRQCREDFLKVELVDHPAVPSPFELASFEDTFFILQGPVLEPDLRAWVERLGVRPMEEVLKVLTQVAELGIAGHRQGLLTLDFCPAVLTVNQKLRIRCLDVGTGYLQSDAPAQVRYRAPERLAGGPITPAADIYAFCAVAYFLLTTTEPFGDLEGEELQEAIASGRAPSLGERFPMLEPQLLQLVDGGLTLEPTARPQAFTEVLEQLHRIAAAGTQRFTRERIVPAVELQPEPAGDTPPPVIQRRGGKRPTARTLRDRLETDAVSKEQVELARQEAGPAGDMDAGAAGLPPVEDAGLLEIAEAKRRAREFIRLKRFKLALKALRRILAYDGKGHQYDAEIVNARKVIAMIEEKQA